MKKSDELGRDLHDRATRGMPLAAEDRTQQEEWYSQQDQCEADTFARAAPPSDLAKLRIDVNRALTQLQNTADRVKVLAGENEVLKPEIATLQQQLQKNARPA